jgi:PhzF family phenazine biosynthesis protein
MQTSHQKIYQVDAFSERLFQGNPAAVCILDEWLPENTMQDIALENNLSETAFVIRQGEAFDIRWFTPSVEVDLCGHATLATAHVLFNHYDYPGDRIRFNTLKRGSISVARAGEYLELDFPADRVKESKAPESVIAALGIEPEEVYRGLNDYLLVYPAQKDIEQMRPDFGMLRDADVRGLIVSAPGEQTDFVSRFFAPGSGIDEDPVTGSAHTTLAPYWGRRLSKKVLTASQLSARGGSLLCLLDGDRVRIRGKAVTYLEGFIQLPG